VTRVEELETAVLSLPEDEYRQFRQWLLDRDWESWDRQIEADSKAGKSDFLRNEAAEAKDARRLKNL
jgi:hypothetical protein